MSGPPCDPQRWSGLDELTAELDWECPYCTARLEIDVQPVEVGTGEGVVNVIEAWCEVCDVRWFPPMAVRVPAEGADSR